MLDSGHAKTQAIGVVAGQTANEIPGVEFKGETPEPAKTMHAGDIASERLISCRAGC